MNPETAINKDKSIAIIQIIFGSILGFFGLISMIACEDNVVFWCVLIFFIAPSVLLFKFARDRINLIDNFSKYKTAMSYSPNGYIPDLAASLNTSEELVKKNLELMIQKKYFPNAYIDLGLNSFVIMNESSDKTKQSPAQKNTKPSSAGTKPTEMIKVTCPGCGAVTAISKGSVGECEYCGTSITQ